MWYRRFLINERCSILEKRIPESHQSYKTMAATGEQQGEQWRRRMSNLQEWKSDVRLVEKLCSFLNPSVGCSKEPYQNTVSLRRFF